MIARFSPAERPLFVKADRALGVARKQVNATVSVRARSRGLTGLSAFYKAAVRDANPLVRKLLRPFRGVLPLPLSSLKSAWPVSRKPGQPQSCGRADIRSSPLGFVLRTLSQFPKEL